MTYHFSLRWTAALLVVGNLACSSGSPTQTAPCPAGNTNCSNVCTNIALDPNNCGSCGFVCPAGKTCTNSQCSCPSGTSDCSGTCKNLQTDAANCGTCGKTCTGSTNLCSNGNCVGSCASGQTQCGSNCVDTKSDRNNCGSCNTACTSSQNCNNGSCVGTGVGGNTGAGGATGNGGSGQGGVTTSQGGAATGGMQNQGGAATGGAQNQGGSSQGGAATGGAQNRGGSSSGGAATGGAQNQGGSSVGGAATGGAQNQGGANVGGANVGGGSAGGPSALSCTDALYGTVNIPAINVISDFENNSLLQYVQDGRGQDALPWYAYAKGDTNDSANIMTTAGPMNPLYSSNAFKVETTTHGPCSKTGALHIKSPGPAAEGDYVGWGIDFMARPAPNKKKQSYDASKYTGVGFWAKCAKDVQFSFFKVVDATQDQDFGSSPPCSYSASPYCNQHGVKNAALTPGTIPASGSTKAEWTYHKLYFSELLQDPSQPISTAAATPPPVDKTKLTAFQIHVNPFSNRKGTKQVNPIDCYIDDVHFLTEAAPAAPTGSVTWTTSGNSITRGTVSNYKIRGLVRPSMEWDCAGFAITREDVKRMKAWHANTIRLAVLDTLWSNGTAGGTDACGNTKGGAASYQREVKRVVSWILQEGMDVILDLHYVAGSPSSAHTTFWDTISKDSFFKDGRIIFELYNEPTADIGSIRTWANTTVTTIRNNGATNLILVPGTDYTYDISGWTGSNAITGKGAIAYVTHPYIFKTTPGDDTAFLTPAKTLPVVATEFGDANVEGFHTIPATQCVASVYSDYITKFEGASMSWTSWAWIVDEWGCGFPQLLTDYSGTPNAIGTPVQSALLQKNP